jgi:hypothetical protein
MQASNTRSKGTAEYLAVARLKSKVRELRRPVTSCNREALRSQLKNILKERRCSVSCNWNWQLAKIATDSISSGYQTSKNNDNHIAPGFHSTSRLSFIYGGYGDDHATWTRNLRQYQHDDLIKAETFGGAHQLRTPYSDTDLLYSQAVKARLQMNASRR